jgi:spore coat protein CotH
MRTVMIKNWIQPLGFLLLAAGPLFAALDSSAPLFDPIRVLEVKLEVAAGDWEKLRQEHPDLLAVLGPDRFTKPPPNQYHTYPAKVVIDGVTVAKVGLRKRGFIGSSSMQRPSLGIRFDEYDKGQRFLGLRRMSLNNNLQDPSQIRQVLAYQLFRSAGVPAPRCSLARVTVNGNYLGVYSHVEAVEEEFLKKQFGETSGNLYEGQISDFRPDWVNTLERKNHKENRDRSDLAAVVKALQASDADLLKALKPVVDLDEYLAFWAVESLIGHWDSYSKGGNNFMVYRVPASGKFSFIPWGADAVLGAPDPFTERATPVSVYAGTALPHRLYRLPEAREEYRQKLREILRTVWKEEALLAEVDRLQKLAKPYLTVEPSQFYSGIINIRSFIRSRREALEAELNGPAPEWPLPLKEGASLQLAGKLRATFSTTWRDKFELGQASPATLTLRLDKGPARTLNFGRVAATPAKDPRSHGSPSLTLFGAQIWDGKFCFAVLIVQPELFKPGTLPVDGFNVMGFYFEAATLNKDQRLLGFLSGKLTLEDASRTNGDTVRGRLEADIHKFQH